MKNHPRWWAYLLTALVTVSMSLAGGTVASAAATATTAHHAKVQIESYKSTLKVNGKTEKAYVDGKRVDSGVTPDYVAQSWTFTPQAPAGSFADGNGSGSEQINYNCSSYTGLCEQWGYQLSDNLQGTVCSTVEESAQLLGNGSLINSYGYHDVYSNYVFHGSYPYIDTQTNYAAQIHIWWTDCGGVSYDLNAEWDYVVTWV